MKQKWIDLSLRNLTERKNDLEKYAEIIDQVHSVNVATDVAFQRKFTYFYKVRRDEEWRKTFFRLFEECKGMDDLTFEYILRTIYEMTGRIEASFSSKMFAALHTQMPIWDRIVLEKLRMKPGAYQDKEKRLKEAVDIYHQIEYWYQGFLQSESSRDFIEAFDTVFPEYREFSDVKKIDFLIWAGGETGPLPQKVIKIDGCVEVPPTVTEDELMEKFIAFIEDNHWYFGGGIYEVKDEA